MIKLAMDIKELAFHIVAIGSTLDEERYYPLTYLGLQGMLYLTYIDLLIYTNDDLRPQPEFLVSQHALIPSNPEIKETFRFYPSHFYPFISEPKKPLPPHVRAYITSNLKEFLKRPNSIVLTLSNEKQEHSGWRRAKMKYLNRVPYNYLLLEKDAWGGEFCNLK